MNNVVDILKKVGALITDSHIVLTSGRHTAAYINPDKILPHTQINSQLGKMFSEKYKNKNIADILDMTVEEAAAFYEHIPRIANKLKYISDVGLGYIKLGQSSTTLSGGEAQRVKLASELSKKSTGNTLYLLDEPTTGLHFEDINKLLKILNRLVNAGNTVIVIEHNLEVIKTADHIIDLGPEGGNLGGEVVAVGTPEEIAATGRSYTGKYLKSYLKNGKHKNQSE